MKGWWMGQYGSPYMHFIPEDAPTQNVGWDVRLRRICDNKYVSTYDGISTKARCPKCQAKLKEMEKHDGED